MITIKDFAQVEMRVGLVTEAAEVEGSEKLLKLTVKVTDEPITVFAGIKKWYKPEDLRDKKFIFVTNLEPRQMPGGELSQAMILGVETEEKYVLLVSSTDVPVGACLR